MWNGKGDSDSAESQKNEYVQDIQNGPHAVSGEQENEEGVGLQRDLKSRHITMIGMVASTPALFFRA